ncbi:TonB-dependent receptor [Chitinophaga japonensis]|nr:TonB-dependent receptor [Chitinophaga japonensis]
MEKKQPVHAYRDRHALLSAIYVMKFTFLIILAACLQVSAKVHSQKVSLQVRDASLKKVLAMIESQTAYHFLFSDRRLKDQHNVNVQVHQADVFNVLEQVLAPASLEYRLLEDNLVVITPRGVTQADVKIQGRVTGPDGTPLVGVTVKVKGTTIGKLTDANGAFELNVPEDAVLECSYIGYETLEVPVNGRTSLSIVLQPSDKSLNEIVVIGYQSVKKKDLTGAVSVVNTQEAQRMTATTVGESIQGLAAGVNVRSGGRPGQESKIEIRGVGTLNNNDPLFVIDGLISYGNRDFNPADVESIQVLKDASAAAIYGANAANGVVIITTKKGKEGPLRVNFNAKYGIQQIPKRWDLTNNYEFAELNKTAYINGGRTPMASVSTEFDPSINTDWQDAVMRTGSYQDYGLDFSGGGKNTSYFISGNYFRNEGTIIGTSFDRISLRVNTEGSRGIFRIGENLSLTNAHEDQLQGNPFYDMVRMLPVIPLYNENNPGGYGYGSDDAYTFGTNPVAINNLIQSDQYNFRIRGNAYAELRPLQWLVYKFNLGVETSFDHYKSLRKEGSWTYNQPVDPSSLYENRAQFLSLLYEHTLNFDRQFGQHTLNGVLGVSQREVTYELTGAGKQHIAQYPAGRYFDQLNAGTTIQTVDGYKERFVTLSYLGRLNYDFADRYLLSLTFRRDGDSRFGEAHRWGNFPSVSGAWRLSKEAFFNVPWVSDLKLRASYGVLGNTSTIPEYARIPSLNLFPYAVFGVGQEIQPGATQTALVNQDIKWEEKRTFNAGVDASFFNNSLDVTAEYYRARTNDILVRLPIAGTTGNAGGNPFTNAASLRNSGVEVSITYRNNKSAFKYQVSGNFTTIKNEVLALGDLGAGRTYIATGLTRTEIGRSIGEWYVLKSNGIFQNQKEIDDYQVQPFAKPGDIRYVNVNGDEIIDNDDRTYVGSPWPKLQTGLSFGGSYKSFSFSLMLYGNFGNKLFNGVRSVMDRFDDNSNYRKGVKPWTEEDPNTDFPRIAYSNELGIQFNTRGDIDRWIEDGSYVRLRNVELGYTLPKAFLQRVGFTQARVYVSGQNLLTFTGYTGLDPDVVGNPDQQLLERGHDTGNYPASRIISFGIQCGF